MTPATFLEEFLRHLSVERGLAENSCLTYRYQLRGYLRFLEGSGRDGHATTRDDVVSYLEARKNDGLKASSLFSAAIAIRQFHRFLAADGRGPADPCHLKLPKFEQRLPKPLAAAEIERLLSVPVGTKFHRLRMFCALSIMWSTGMRVSEVTGLTINQIDFDENFIRVFGKGSKERLAPIGPKAKEALLCYLEVRKGRRGAGSDVLFLTDRGHPWTRGAFWWHLKKLAKEAGVVGRVHPHRVRHGFATVLLDGGANLRIVQEALSHADIGTTQRYTHVTAEHLRKACQNAHPRF